MSEELLRTINVNVAGRMFPVKVTEEEEIAVRQIEKDLNHRIKEFQLEYATKDKHDAISMTLLTYAFDLHKSKKITENIAVDNKLDIIEDILDEALR